MQIIMRRKFVRMAPDAEVVNVKIDRRAAEKHFVITVPFMPSADREGGDCTRLERSLHDSDAAKRTGKSGRRGGAARIPWRGWTSLGERLSSPLQAWLTT